MEHTPGVACKDLSLHSRGRGLSGKRQKPLASVDPFLTVLISYARCQNTTATMKAKTAQLMGNSTHSMRMSSSMAARMGPIQLSGFWALSSTCCLEDATGLALSGLAPVVEAMEISSDPAVPWLKDRASVGGALLIDLLVLVHGCLE